MSSESVYADATHEGQSTEGRILAFNRNRGIQGSTAPSLSVQIISDPSFRQDIKEIVEGLVIRVMSERYAEALSATANPFDSLLVLDLCPDQVSPTDVQLLERLSARIEDRSAEIEFTDDME